MKLLFIGFGATGVAIANKLKSNNEIYFYDIKNIKSEFKQIKLNDIKNTDFDYILIILSSISKNKRKKLAMIYKSTLKMRDEEFTDNIKKINKITPHIKNNKSTIIVISNPIDKIVDYLTKKLHNQVIGFGMALDSKRYSTELNKNIDCIGLHGNSIPLIDLKNKEEFIAKLEEQNRQLNEQIAQSGQKIQDMEQQSGQHAFQLEGELKQVQESIAAKISQAEEPLNTKIKDLQAQYEAISKSHDEKQKQISEREDKLNRIKE